MFVNMGLFNNIFELSFVLRGLCIEKIGFSIVYTIEFMRGFR